MMKRWLSIILACVMCLSLCACGGKEDAFDNSKEAFTLVTEAYLATNEFSHDIYEAWYLGVNQKSSYDDDYEFTSFAAQMSIERSAIEQAVLNLLGETHFINSYWERVPGLYGGSCFSAWVSVISEAYKCSGKVAEIEGKLNEAKALMKELGDEYSDYEHYPSLKQYFTNSIAFLDFCRNPEGSFEQVVETFNTYRNNAREYFFDLNYIFNDSIAGMEPQEETDESGDSDDSGNSGSNGSGDSIYDDVFGQ